MGRQFANRFDDLALAIVVWMCPLPLAGMLVYPFFGLRSAGLRSELKYNPLRHFAYLLDRQYGAGHFVPRQYYQLKVPSCRYSINIKTM